MSEVATGYSVALEQGWWTWRPTHSRMQKKCAGVISDFYAPWRAQRAERVTTTKVVRSDALSEDGGASKSCVTSTKHKERKIGVGVGHIPVLFFFLLIEDRPKTQSFSALTKRAKKAISAAQLLCGLEKIIFKRRC